MLGTHHELAHELDGRVDICLYQLLRRFRPNSRNVCEIRDILEGLALESCVLLSCGGPRHDCLIVTHGSVGKRNAKRGTRTVLVCQPGSSTRANDTR